MIKTALGRYTRFCIAVMVMFEFSLPLMVLYLVSRKRANEASNTATEFLKNFIQTKPKEIIL